MESKKRLAKEERSTLTKAQEVRYGRAFKSADRAALRAKQMENL